MKSAGGKPKSSLQEDLRAAENKPLSSRMLVTSMLVLVFCLLMNQVGLFVPLIIMARNCALSKVPPSVLPKYATCSDQMLANEMTIIVTVKDTCSQLPGFLTGLERFAPPSVHLIYTFPNFKSCATIDLSPQLKYWKKVTKIPLPLRASPMQGWLDAIPYVKTKYSMLLHNDGYALDSFFGCELLQALKARQRDEPESNYSLAAPMLFESKADGSLAAHATQTNLRLVEDDSSQGMTVRHDHSLRRALNRGRDYQEGPQTDFVEDHGFLIDTDKIATVIDPKASFTLEYIDMIMTIRAKGWKVLFTPTARLEFRVTEFSWRDIPYFMYKRSEATAHGTRDYLMAKWQANFPNTGFWTYIKYTIIEQHVYRDELRRVCDASVANPSAHGCDLHLPTAWKDQAALVFGFFQMVGYNRYQLGGKTVDFIEVLERLDRGWGPSSKEPVHVSRTLWRPPIKNPRATYLSSREILPVGPAGTGVEAEMEHEYLPFSVAKLTFGSCAAVPDGIDAVCGLLLEQAEGCVCWINMPTFKSNSLLIRFIAALAALVKLPSRVTTFVEMALDGSRNGTEHVLPLRKFEGSSFALSTCDLREAECTGQFSFDKRSRLKLFRGAPATPSEVTAALTAAI